MAVFNHKISYRIVTEDIDPDVDIRIITVDYDDGFGVRRSYSTPCLAADVAYVQVGGTAMSSVNVFPGTVIRIDLVAQEVLVLANGRVISCTRDEDEQLQVNDKVFAVEHMRNRNGEEYGQFDWLATKREADFRLNAIRIMMFDHEHTEFAVIHLDPYLAGHVRDGRI